MTEPPTHQELADAWTRVHLRSFVECVLFALKAAVTVDPEGLRSALKDVFSSEAVDDMARRSITLASAAQQAACEAATDTRILLDSIGKDMDAVQARLDGLNLYLDRLREKIKKPQGVKP